MKRLSALAILFILFVSSLSAQGVGFDAKLIGGISAAQIRGDELAGFSKLGIEAGIGASYEIRYNMELGLELLYSQRGSTPDVSFSPSASPTYKLNYVSIPIVYTIKDWLFEEPNELSYYRVKAHAGLSYGRLITKSIEGDLGAILTSELSDAFRDDDLSWLIGMGYQFSYHLGFRLRYHRSITKLFSAKEHPQINAGDLLPFHLSLQFTYKL